MDEWPIFTDEERHKKSWDRRMVIVVVASMQVVGFGLAFLIGWFSHTMPSTSCLPMNKFDDTDSDITAKIFEKLNAENIRSNLRQYTSYSHMAGTPGEERLAVEIENAWKEQSLDLVTRKTYDVLLSYPNSTNPSLVQVLDENSRVVYQSAGSEEVLTPEQNKSDVIPPFNAYSPPGDITGDLVYAYYGRKEDYELLERNYSINLTNKIVIARFGMIYRGDIVKFAAEYGAAGVILYMDPVDFYKNESEGVFPKSWWLPGSGLQRGSMLQGDGDPLTPNYPATENAYRILEENSKMLPRIPVHPIGYDDAYHFLSKMKGESAPSEWQGSLNFTYRIGPGLNATGWKTRLFVTTYNQRANTSNVFGFIYGSEEPDRYVLVGNHRDAWVFGGIDPTSGTALMVELSRVFMEIVKEGWRPRRTIVFCSWGAEEYALVGSYEWVEDFVKQLSDRAVAYLNVDYVLDGTVALTVDAMPTLRDLVIHTAQKVPSHRNSSATMYDDWIKVFPGVDQHNNKTGKPKIGEIGDSSDTGGFMLAAGVTCYDVWFTHDMDVNQYPLYHTVYDGFILVDQIMDPQYKTFLAMGKFWGESLRNLSDSLVLPLNAVDYGKSLISYIDQLDSGYGDLMRSRNISLEPLYEAGKKFETATIDFHERLSRANLTSPLQIRMYNDQLMLVDRAFIDPIGLPLRPTMRHVLFAPSMFDSYAGSTFPGLSDLMYEIEKQVDPEAQWEKVKQHYATILYCISSATASLLPVGDFMNN